MQWMPPLSLLQKKVWTEVLCLQVSVNVSALQSIRAQSGSKCLSNAYVTLYNWFHYLMLIVSKTAFCHPKVFFSLTEARWNKGDSPCFIPHPYFCPFNTYLVQLHWLLNAWAMSAGAQRWKKNWTSVWTFSQTGDRMNASVLFLKLLKVCANWTDELIMQIPFWHDPNNFDGSSSLQLRSG